MRSHSLALLVVCWAIPAQAETHLDFVQAYIRALSNLESIRTDAQAELAKSSSVQDTFSSCIHSSHLQQLELANAANTIAKFKLTGPSKGSPALLVQYFVTKGEMFKRLESICSAIVAGPKPGIDYQKLASDMPKLRADMEYLDKNLLTAAPLVFGSLIRETPDKQGHMSRLVISHAERNSLVNQINTSFKKVDAKGGTYAVSSASIIKNYLTKKGFKLIDDPE